MAVTRETLEAIIGPATLVKWADLTGRRDNDAIAERIAWAISLATVMVQSKLRLTTYDLDDAMALAHVEYMIAIKASDLLYGPRRVAEDEDDDLMKGFRTEYNNFVKDVAKGTVNLGLAQQVRPYPVAVRDDETTNAGLPEGIIGIITDE